ncbi:Inositol polyphosphate 4-phosphatase type II [Mortierella sp. GBA43]|nr:Inositol polyphosphate 4-phosphatase type II [Mortierella sp. GBA43]
MHLCVSVSIDPDQHYQKLVKAKVHVVLVLTALMELPDHCETWIELSRTELMTLEKGRVKGQFVKTLPIEIKENFLMVGFTLLVMPPSNTSHKVITAFPGLDGLIPWAETSVAIEHFALDPNTEFNNHQPQLRSSSFSTPLMEVSLLPDTGLRKSKHTVATLNVNVEESVPKLPLHKAMAESNRVGHSFTQTYHGRTVRGTVVYGREHLYESPLAFTVPLKLLQLLAEDERRVLEELEREPSVSLSDLIQAVPLDHKPNPLTRGASFMDTLRRSAGRPGSAKDEALKSARARQIGLSEEDSQLQKLLRQQISTHRNIEMHYREMAMKVEQKLKENMETGQGPFRRSPEKKQEAVQWIPLNCCIQDFLVYDEGHQTNYQSTTVGAAAVHGAGFAHWTSPSLLDTTPQLGAYWSKQERGSDLLRDLKALQDIVESCSSEFSSLLVSIGNNNQTRAAALIKEIQFLNGQIVSFGDRLFADYLTSSTTEDSAQFICGEIADLIDRLRHIDLTGDDIQDQNHGYMGNMADYKRLIREVVSCTRDLYNFVAIAIQYECLIADATLEATPEWILVKKTRECCLSQFITALATSFMAILEDWWSNMAVALQEQRAIERRQQEQHRPECHQYCPRDMDVIAEESSGTSSRPHDASKKRRCSIKRNGKGISGRRASVRSTLSSTSSGSYGSTHGGSEYDPRSKRHPLEDMSQAKAQNNLFWDQLMSLGWLVQIGSLLSTQGNELGMLLDYAQAVEDARESVTISFHALPQSADLLSGASRAQSPSRTVRPDQEDIEDNIIQVSGRRGQITLSFGLSPLQFSLLPDQLKSGVSKIHVWPILFSQGINEMQTISNLTGKSPSQRSVNEEGLRQMQSYALRYHTWHMQAQVVHGIQEAAFDKSTRRQSFAGPFPAAMRKRADRSSGSLMSNFSADWDIVSPTGAETWDGEPLVAELLRHLEVAVLGHSDETNGIFESSTTPASPGLQDSFGIEGTSYGSTTYDESSPASIAGSATGILGSMMEYGTSKLFSFRGSKDTSILECAEALTRAMGQIKAPADTKDPKSPEEPPMDSECCDCFRSSTSPAAMPFSSLWVTSHIASCKSSKDRTSMSVTLSQVNLLRACHGLQTGSEQNGEDDWQAILDAMRSEIGVRIKNVERNLKLGDFAKDLLWLSAFGSEASQPLPSPVFGITHQESSYTPDALTYVRSLLPGAPQSDTRSEVGVGSLDTNDDLESQYVSVEPADANPDDDEADDTDSLPSSRAMSPTSFGSPPPPLRLIRSPTGHALEPVITRDTEYGASSTGDRRSSLLLEPRPMISEPADRPEGISRTQSPIPGEDSYTSFPECFDEPQLAVRLARSLGLDTIGKPSTPEPTVESALQQGRSLGVSSPNHASQPMGVHRPTPSWSSQQSILYQQQQTQSSVRDRRPQPMSPRFGGFGPGTGLRSWSRDSDTLSHSSSIHVRRQSYNSVDNGSASHFSTSPNFNSRRTVASASPGALGKRGKFAFNKVQIGFLPEAYRPPLRMTSKMFET